MIRFNGHDFYYLGATLRPLASLSKTETVRELEGILLPAVHALDFVLAPGRFVPDLAFSRAEGNALREAIRSIARAPDGTQLPIETLDAPIDAGKHAWIVQAADAYAKVLAADLRAQNLWVVPDRGAYNGDTLIFRGEKLIPDNILPWLPEEAIADLRQAGRCLAFDVSTAAGFHFLRATESTMRRYYSCITCRPELTGRMRNWGRYVELLTKAGGEHRAVKSIDQVRELYRNPVVHPETVLSLNDALGLFAMCVGILVAIVSDLERRCAP